MLHIGKRYDENGKQKLYYSLVHGVMNAFIFLCALLRGLYIVTNAGDIVLYIIYFISGFLEVLFGRMVINFILVTLNLIILDVLLYCCVVCPLTILPALTHMQSFLSLLTWSSI